MTPRIVVAGSRPYEVVIAEDFSGLGAACGENEAVLVTESRVGPLWASVAAAVLGDRLRATVVLPEGERHKTLETATLAVDGLIAAGCDRSTVVVALGGGVLGDVAGLAAALTLRGLPLLQVPTTLVAMVDSSIGGKVGVNHPAGKNLIGAFYPPIGVYTPLEALATLDPIEISAGLGEVVKTALVGDAALLSALETGTRPPWARVVADCARVKAAIVSEDERETGRRAVLNAGHTLGHALETLLGPQRVRHGEAVAIGLVAEARFARQIGLSAESGLPERLARLFDRLGVAHRWPECDPERIVAGMGVDKKNRRDRIRLPLPVRVGEVVIVDLPRGDLPSLVRAAMEQE